MPHLYLLDQPIRFESAEAAANLERKGWTILPEQPDPTATWDGSQWLTPTPPEPVPDYLAFWDAVLVSQIYAAMLGHAMTSLPTNTALTAFIAAFQDAKEGRPNVPAIQACIYLAMQAAAEVLTKADLLELHELMVQHRLSDVFALTPPTP
jgi:hypothetical protein